MDFLIISYEVTYYWCEVNPLHLSHAFLAGYFRYINVGNSDDKNKRDQQDVVNVWGQVKHH